MIIKRALISVSEKHGIVEFAKELQDLAVEILSTGGTSKLLRENNIPVKDVSEETGFQEIMDGRVKTLHPKIHGGILARRGVDDLVMKEQGITPIDLVVVNLYPFEETIKKPDSDFAMAIENIDIGGPTIIRAAAKNHAFVAVVVDNNDFSLVLDELKTNHGAISQSIRERLAKKAFALTARYDGAISNYLAKQDKEDIFPDTYTCQFTNSKALRYGENPHQQAIFYREPNKVGACVANAKQLQGKALSFNNINDTDAALECVRSFKDSAACVIVKHANPCGVAVSDTQLNAYKRAFRTDPTSSFGGIIAFNAQLTVETAKAIIDNQFVEVVIAPSIKEEALAALSLKPNVRVLVCGDLNTGQACLEYRSVNGGMLVQEYDRGNEETSLFRIVSENMPTDNQMRDLHFAWLVAKQVKSNAIVYAKDQATVGIGAGQMSRVYSAKVAIMKAENEGLTVKNSVMASDAFFPFRDSIDEAAKAGVKAIIQPGGSIRDQEVIDAANEAGIAMVFTGVRHFRH